jgi:hypothetical protein
MTQKFGFRVLFIRAENISVTPGFVPCWNRGGT